MDAANREQETTTSRPAFRLVTRDGQKPVMEPPPPPGDADEHPGDEPGYGHGV
jgi:hypothetical protein